jgi:hypothetical protein
VNCDTRGRVFSSSFCGFLSLVVWDLAEVKVAKGMTTMVVVATIVFKDKVLESKFLFQLCNNHFLNNILINKLLFMSFYTATLPACQSWFASWFGYKSKPRGLDISQITMKKTKSWVLV